MIKMKLFVLFISIGTAFEWASFHLDSYDEIKRFLKSKQEARNYDLRQKLLPKSRILSTR